MAITAGTSPFMPIDFGLTEKFFGDTSNYRQNLVPASQSNTGGLDYSNTQNQSLQQDLQSVGPNQTPAYTNATNALYSAQPNQSIEVQSVERSPQIQTSSNYSGMNPAQKTDYAKSQGYDGPSAYEDALNAAKQASKPDMNAINDVYNPINEYLSGEQSRISGQMPSVLQSAQESFDNSKNTLNTGFEQGNTQLGEQNISAEQAKINEQNEQRQLYNELAMGGNQRFGGASSASEAYRALLGQEQQRVGAATSQQYQTAKREIETAKFNLQQDYTNQIASLEQQNRDTQNAIRMEFDDRLSQIRSMRAESESAKANAKLGALQQYKADMYNLSMANMQYKHELQLQAQAASSQINDAQAQWDQMMMDGQNSVNTFNEQTAGQPTTKLTFGASGGGSSGSFTPVGQITSGKKDEDNIFTSMFGGGNAGGGAG